MQMTLETRIRTGWQYKADGANAIIEKFGYGDTAYGLAEFQRDLSAEIRRATATDAGTYGDYDEMVEEREHVLVELLGSCEPGDTGDIGDALDEIYAWAENYDVWLGR